ncbi:DUF2848 family protein [Haloactinomyces albus]|uniref:4-hydroxyphenylacetate 3-monooxygenase n=1 Tax=Haloactinomyces albus TaxID=1352928 RepID=A0AAE4CMT8_9ACTN|nr:DUF2848 family protein [Haloactinomyces albus]MDR7303760.1 4-hydroxyphenylacetate 3-monooxygenase [Haloactinomyces albus]
MTENQAALQLHIAGEGRVLDVVPEQLIVAGYTARDERAVAEHIAELAAIGVPEPASVPAFYELDPALLTTEAVVAIDGSMTSGEVEPVLIRHQGSYYLAVGSDHTDRDLERHEIAASKAACPKPVGQLVLPLGEDLSAVDWDSITVSSSADEVPYQRGTLAALRTPDDLMSRLTATLGEIDGDLVIFGGTLPLLTGEFVHGSYWRIHLALANGTTLTHSYETKQRSL